MSSMSDRERMRERKREGGREREKERDRGREGERTRKKGGGREFHRDITSTSGTQSAGMNLLSKFCIAVSATQKSNCVAVGVICVAVFWCALEKKIMLNSVTLSQLNQSRELNILKKKKIVLPLQQ